MSRTVCRNGGKQILCSESIDVVSVKLTSH